MSALYTIGNGWEDVSDRERFNMKELIGRIVRYPCKVACKSADGVVDVYVMSDKTGRIEDWIEIHENGAIWPIEEMYEEKRRRLRDSVTAACNMYNDEHSVEVPDMEDDGEEEESLEESHAGSEEDSDESDSDEEEEDDNKGEPDESQT